MNVNLKKGYHQGKTKKRVKKDSDIDNTSSINAVMRELARSSGGRYE